MKISLTMSHYCSINVLERLLWHAKAFMTSCKSRQRTQALTDNIANDDCLLSVIVIRPVEGFDQFQFAETPF